MRISTLAALMILTTVMLSLTACSQSNVAQVINRDGRSFGEYNSQPRYSRYSPPPPNPTIDYKYKDEQYGVDAGVSSVSSSDLPAPDNLNSNTYNKVLSSPASAPASETSKKSSQNGSYLDEKSFKYEPQQKSADKFAANEGGFNWPAQGKILRKFGSQKAGVVSDGISIATPSGMPIHAAKSGEVAYVGNALKDYGNMLIIRHKDGVMTSYAHADKITVKKGDFVKIGQTVGYVGKTGNVSEPQLHFTLRENNKPVDPMNYLPVSFASR